MKVTRTKRRLKPWVKKVLLLIVGAIIGITIYQLFTVTTVKSTPLGDYTCNGGIIQVCTGSKKVATYLGV
jgi:hypothetical protein